MKKIFTLISAVMLCLGASAQTQKLADVIKATMDTCQHEIVPVFLTKYVTYELDSQVELGQKGVIIWGGEATIIVKGEGQIATQGYLQVRNANFDCAEGTVAPIALSATPDESLLINDPVSSSIVYEGANQKVYYNNHKVSVVKCNFRELKTSLFYSNKAKWALNTLELDRNVVQLNHDVEDPLINWFGNTESKGAIKNIVLTNNLIYNIQNSTKTRFIRYSHASNAQPAKVWGTGAKSSFVMTNNTIAYPCKEFANNFVTHKDMILDWKKNIFINVTRLQKIGSNNTRNFTAEDNILFNNNDVSYDGTDTANYGTPEEIGVTIPEIALDFDNINSLKDYFYPTSNKPYVYSYGVTRWGTFVVKEGVAKTPGQSYEAAITYDMVIKKMKDGTQKNGIDTENFPWVVYNYAGSILDDGTSETSAANAYTSYDRVTGEYLEQADRKMLPTTDGRWVAGYPKVEDGFYFDAEGNQIDCKKTIKFYVSDVNKLRILLTGGGSKEKTNTANVVIKDIRTGEVIAEQPSGDMTNKSTKNNNCNSQLLTFEGLDLTKSYEIEILPVIGSSIVCAIHLFNGDDSVFPVCHAPGEKAPGTNYEVVLGPDMLAQYALVENPEVTKPGINVEEYPWITYVREDGLNVLENGQNEAQQAKNWTDLDPTTGEKGTWLQATGKNGSVNSPVIAAEYGKYMVANIMDATKFRVYATGSASTSAATGDQLILTATGNDGSVITAATTPGTIWGKGKASDYAELTLNPNRAYTIKIETAFKSMQITGFNITGTDLSIAPAEDNPGLGDATGIENVENNNVDANAPAYNIAGQRVNGAAKGLIIKGGKKYIIR